MAVSREEAAMGFCSAGVLYFSVHDAGCLSACRGFFQEPFTSMMVVRCLSAYRCRAGQGIPSQAVNL